jgi:capsular exopolysaccharide synthesis family protein
LGKIFNALEKYRKERRDTAPALPLEQTDWDALLQYNRRTGKLNLHNRGIIKDPATIHRLLENKMILPDGSLTAAAKKKCEEMTRQMRISMAGQKIGTEDGKKDFSEAGNSISKLKLSESDWNILNSYDRKTGHLLHYHPDTGELEKGSIELIRDRGIIQRLLKNDLIFPDGKLTAVAIKYCDELTNHLISPEGIAAVSDDPASDEKQNKAADQKPEPLKPKDLAALMKYDRETKNILKYDEETGKLGDESRSILRDSDIIQRLIENEMILPGGWLTPKGLQECDKLEDREKKPRTEELTPQGTGIEQRQATKSTSTDRELREETKKETSTPKQTPSKVSVENKKKVTAAREAGPIISKYEKPEPSKDKIFRKERSRSKTDKVSYKFDAIDKNLVSLLAPQSYEAEQFKILRTNLLFPVKGEPPRSILVTSPAPGDGKSFVAANLAISIASDIDRHVLLMDCDLRRPAIHKQFGFRDVQGLSDYLSKGTPLPSLLLNTKVKKLTILPAGEPPGNPSELLSSELMAALMTEVTERYYDRLIIIDSPPPNLTAETVALARNVDGILLVVKYGKTQGKMLKELLGELGEDKILGSIINYYDVGSSGYYAHKAYRKYRRHYSK